MGESYVRPVTRAREPRPEWVSVWLFRVAILAVSVAILVGAVFVFRTYFDDNRAQDPDFDQGLRPVLEQVEQQDQRQGHRG